MFRGYGLSEKLYESKNSLIWRGVCQTSRQSVILKLLNQNYPAPERLIRFRQEFEILHTLHQAATPVNASAVIKTLGWNRYQHSFYMVLEDFGGQSLDAWLYRHASPGTGLRISEFLEIAIDITVALGQIHQQHIVHRDINPSNIVYNASTGQLKLIDFGIAMAQPQASPLFQSPWGLEGTLAYMSPEQTGRMNRSVDYRTDFYSLGVTFYELLSGQLPFPTRDVLELLHCHLARQPLPLNELRKVPIAIATLVMKLLEKDPDNRYQSAAGLLADLQQCQQWQQWGRFEPLIPGRSDRSDQFHLPQRLYGRDQEVGLLLQVFEQVSQPHVALAEVGAKSGGMGAIARPELQDADPGTSALVLIAGLSGIGKTALAQELYQPITRQRGYFIAGKFDQFQRNVPYSAWVQAFRSLIRQLLTERDIEILAWRDRLQTALGNNGQVLIEVLPEVELILGPQPVVAPLPPTESQNRFRLVFHNFVQVFTQPEHPLVIFLDDLQWADVASLQLLEALLLAPDARSLLLVGAYRDNEVGQTHALQLTLDTLQAAGKAVHTLCLPPLSLADITHLVADTLHCDWERAEPLAALIRTKTEGYPFFVRELLTSLHTHRLITFDYQQSIWQWELEQIRTWQVSDNVVGLMTHKMQQLPPETQRILQVAACLGNRFDLQTLALVQQTTRCVIYQALLPAIAQGIILALASTHPWIEVELPEVAATLTVDYKFVHDRVQQAAYAQVIAGDQAALHYQIGYLLWRHTPADEQDDRLFEMVNHLNQGSPRMQNRAERTELAHLNLRAARKAKDAAAYAAALGYCTTGLDLLQPTGWEQQYSLTLSLCSEAAEAAYMTRNFAAMDALVQEVQHQARLPLEQVKVYQVKIQALGHQDRPLEAIQVGQEILRLLGVPLPAEPTHQQAEAALQTLQTQLQGLELDQLLALPAMTAPESEAIMQILASLIPPAYNLMPPLFILLVVQQVQRSLHDGNTALSCLAYALYGIVICGAGEIERGYRFGQLALTLIEQLHARPLKAGVTHLLTLFVAPWKMPVRQELATSIAMYRLGLETGDFIYAAYSAHVYCAYALCCGQELTRLAADLATYTAAIAELQQAAALCLNQIVYQACLNLLGQAQRPWLLTGTVFNEESALPQLQQSQNSTAIFLLLIYRLMLAYLFGQYAHALRTIELAEAHLQGVTGMLYVPVFYFYDSLTRLALLQPWQVANGNLRSQAVRSQVLERVAANQQKLANWAAHAPANYQHKYHLVAAELARVQGQDGEAREQYDRAIALATQAEYVNEVALANELAARFYLTKSLVRLAQVYLQEAHYAYRRWGAIAKVEQLEADYPDFLVQGNDSISSSLATTHPESSRSQVHAVLDLASVVKASQAISEEIVLPNLLKKLLRITMENAGAQRGFLILGQPHQLTVEIGCQVVAEVVGEEEFLLMDPLPLDEAGQYLATTIVHYVARTQADMVLGAATAAEAFIQDVYIQTQQPKSVLCMPILRGGQLFGILYLENPLVTNSFTPERIEALHLISAQAAISLENARLYANLENLVEDRTTQLRVALGDLETLATTDQLTGVYNRHKFEDLIHQEMNRALRFQRPLSLLILDIDRFKTINDTYGHLIGDRVLATLARVVQENIRNIDALIRWGGEEFLVLASETQLAAALTLAEKLRQAIEQYPFPEVACVTISLGVAEFRADDTPSSLTKRADNALYRAKRHGRNRVEAEPA